MSYRAIGFFLPEKKDDHSDTPVKTGIEAEIEAAAKAAECMAAGGQWTGLQCLFPTPPVVPGQPPAPPPPSPPAAPPATTGGGGGSLVQPPIGKASLFSTNTGVGMAAVVGAAMLGAAWWFTR